MTKTNAKKRAFPIYLLAAYLLMLVALTSGITLAKYTTSSGDVSDSARVAKYVFDITDGEGDSSFATLSGMCKPGDIVYYEIIVNNYKDVDGAVEICEVAQSYSIKTTLIGSLPITAVLYEGEVNADNISDAQLLSEITTQVNTNTCSNVAEMAPAQEISHKYTLVVSWPESENGLQYSRGGIADVEVVVVSEQID